MTDDPTLQTARDLREIIRLAGELESRAFDQADDHDMPGGDALASLAPVASPEAVWNVVDGRELWNTTHDVKRDLTHLEDGDIWESPLETLVRWSERLRYDHGAMSDGSPTIESETRWLTNMLSWIYDHEPRFDNFARDIRRTRRRLEALLSEGERQTPGIQCPRCRQAAMIRTEHDRSKPRDCGGHGPLETCPIPRQGCCERGGLIEQWSCPECGHRLANTPEHAEYDEAVFKDYIGSAPYLEGKYVERRTNVPIGTVRVWVQRGYVRTRKDARDTLVYCIADIEARFAGNRAIDMTDSA